MGDLKARFHFATEGQNSKSTAVKVKTIQLINQLEIFEFPVDQQTAAYHKELFQHSVVKGVVKSLKERNKFRNVVITLTKEGFRDGYVDEEGNIVFNGYYLEAVTDIQSSQSPLQGPSPVQEKPIHSIAKNMVLEKFNGKNFNAESWLNMFEGECNRLNIREGRFAEVLRLFLENSALNWHAIFLKTHSLAHDWELWNNSFIETFGQKSWSDIEYAYTYKYLNGAFFEFALKKRNLLIDVDPELTINSQIKLIVIALPNYVKSKLNDKIETIENLMAKLKTIEPMTNKFKNSGVENNAKQKQNNSNERKGNNHSPCTYCENIGYPNRYHPENLCRTKLNKTIQKNEKIKIVNNTELQNLISSTEEAKN
ncbi:hypothetical protein ALC57_13591 [Trachymyrmex cornetzi]|uniref:Retrotransposon gag domain-containing protein n=1 Tax=Trachymyrmex cornetzi TaxID=471704 RepID=A0A151IZ78_9HYME|nr:hypothetical protein ALC57_13591 [Trachymyrmex cornetzi]